MLLPDSAPPVKGQAVPSSRNNMRNNRLTSRIQETLLGANPVVFFTIIALVLTAAALMAGKGLDDLATLRDDYYERVGNARASAPVAFGSGYVFSHNLGTAKASALTLVLRVDSLATVTGSPDGCKYLEELHHSTDEQGVVLRLMNTRADPPVCAGSQIPQDRWEELPLTASRRSRSEWRDSRWAIVDANGRTIYSRTELPRPSDISSVLNVLRGPAFQVTAR